MVIYALLTTTWLLFCYTHAQSIDGYALQKDYGAGSDFFSNFNFQVFAGGDDVEAQDPTNGFTWYVDEATARASGYIRDDDLYIGVDYSNVTTAANKSREAVRLQSKDAYTHGLFVLDLGHMPGGICGTWPAWWLYGEQSDTAPSGEIDMIEQANLAATNEMTIYAYRNDRSKKSACRLDAQADMYGVYEDDRDCIPKDDTDPGCQIADDREGTFGMPFNANGGGVYATEWLSSGIRIWWWPHSSVPNATTGGPLGTAPAPSTWGRPAGTFIGCPFDEFLGNQQIQLNTAFCGDEAGVTWDDQCRNATGVATCYDYVRENPAAFKDAYWQVNSLRVFRRANDTVESGGGGGGGGDGDKSGADGTRFAWSSVVVAMIVWWVVW